MVNNSTSNTKKKKCHVTLGNLYIWDKNNLKQNVRCLAITNQSINQKFLLIGNINFLKFTFFFIYRSNVKPAMH
jgi:hypothetical protein